MATPGFSTALERLGPGLPCHCTRPTHGTCTKCATEDVPLTVHSAAAVEARACAARSKTVTGTRAPPRTNGQEDPLSLSRSPACRLSNRSKVPGWVPTETCIGQIPTGFMSTTHDSLLTAVVPLTVHSGRVARACAVRCKTVTGTRAPPRTNGQEDPLSLSRSLALSLSRLQAL